MSIGRGIAATRPAFLSITVLAVMVGLAHGTWRGPGHMVDVWPVALLALFSVLLAHAATNVLNDVADADNGSDVQNIDRVAPFTGGSRFIQDGLLTRRQMFRLAGGLFAASVASGVVLLALSDLRLVWFGLAGLLLGVAYSAPPWQLMSRGWGEAAVAGAFAVIVAGADFVVRRALDPASSGAAWSLAAQAALILIVNEIPDRAADLAAGKRNLIVRLGPAGAAWLYGAVATASYAVLAFALAQSSLPSASALAALALPCGVSATVLIARHVGNPRAMRWPIVLTLTQAHVFAAGLLIGLLLAARQESIH